MTAALTLMPALLSKVGGRVKPAGNGGADVADRETGFPARWGRFVADRPLPGAVLALSGLIALALPPTPLRLASGGASTPQKTRTSRGRYHLPKTGVGP